MREYARYVKAYNVRTYVYRDIARFLARAKNVRYGILTKCVCIIPGRRVKMFRVLEGYLYLFSMNDMKNVYMYLKKNSLCDEQVNVIDLVNNTLELEMYSIRFSENAKKVVIRPSKRLLKFQLENVIRVASQRAKYIVIYISRVNKEVRRIKNLLSDVYIEYEVLFRLQRKIEKEVIKQMCSMYAMSKSQAQHIYATKFTHLINQKKRSKPN